VALVTICCPASGATIPNVPMLLDTGADVSLVPREAIVGRIEIASIAVRYELQSFDGTRSIAPAVELELQFLGKSFRGQFLVVDGRHGILGRNTLNSLSLLLDGPSLIWTENR
jgi:hypothetical protein